MKAVIRDGSQQFLVEEGQIVEIERTGLEPKSTYSFEVLSITKDDGETLIGEPVLDNAKVEGEVITQVKKKKIIIYFFRRRKASKKKQGHRQQKTLIRRFCARHRWNPDAASFA